MVGEEQIGLTDWLNVLKSDYIETFVADGGAATKVVVAQAEVRLGLRHGISQIAEATGFQYAHVDSATRRVHLVHPMFSEVAHQLDWPMIARRFMARSLQDRSYEVPENEDLDLDSLAGANGLAPGIMRQELRRIWSERVFRDYDLGRDFRFGALALCRSLSEQSDEHVRRLAQDVTLWFRGEVERVSVLRHLGIFRKIGRNNARQLLRSTAIWLRKAGFGGLIVTVDIARYVLGKSAEAGGNTYTRLATLDMYEVLRQFIDSTDDQSGLVLLFLIDDRFLTSDDRGLRSYDALRLRLTDDVRDRSRPNPLAPMVRLGGVA